MRDVTSLAAVPLSTSATIVTCLAEPGTRARLATLGIRYGARVTVTQEIPGGGRVLAVTGSRIALSRSVLKQLHALPELVQP